MNVLGAAAAHAIDEVGVVVGGASAVRAGFDFIGDPRFVGVVAIDGQIAVGVVENVAGGIGLGIFRAEGLLFVGGLFACRGGQSRGRHAAGAVRASADLRFVIGDPVADFEVHHFALAIGSIENEGGIQGIGRFLVVVEHKMPAHRGYRYRKANAQTPAGDIDFVDGLVADFAVAGVPDPVPIIEEAIAGEGLQRRGAGPEIVINTGGDGFLGGVAD